MKKIPLSRPDHPDDPSALLTTLREVVLSGRWTEGEYAHSFERRVAEACGAVYAIATNSGTSALEMICEAIGLASGDEVICPSYTFIATVNAVLSSGATPVFADIDPKTYNLNLEDVAKKITPKTKAVVLVHQFGIPSDGTLFAKFCMDRKLTLIEDAACGMGSKFGDKSVGTFGRAGLLSFHPRKVLSTGEGGMVITDDAQIANRARAFGNHGRANNVEKMAEGVGHNFRMSEFQAALGLWALDRLGEGVARRVAIARRYEEGLQKTKNARLLLEPGRGVWNHQSYPIRVPGDRRNLIADSLRKKGIETSPGPLPAHVHPYIEARLHPPRLPETETAYAETLLLPMYASLKPEDQKCVIDALVDAIG